MLFSRRQFFYISAVVIGGFLANPWYIFSATSASAAPTIRSEDGLELKIEKVKLGREKFHTGSLDEGLILTGHGAQFARTQDDVSMIFRSPVDPRTPAKKYGRLNWVDLGLKLGNNFQTIREVTYHVADVDFFHLTFDQNSPSRTYDLSVFRNDTHVCRQAHMSPNGKYVATIEDDLKNRSLNLINLEQGGKGLSFSLSKTPDNYYDLLDDVKVDNSGRVWFRLAKGYSNANNNGSLYMIDSNELQSPNALKHIKADLPEVTSYDIDADGSKVIAVSYPIFGKSGFRACYADLDEGGNIIGSEKISLDTDYEYLLFGEYIPRLNPSGTVGSICVQGGVDPSRSSEYSYRNVATTKTIELGTHNSIKIEQLYDPGELIENMTGFGVTDPCVENSEELGMMYLLTGESKHAGLFQLDRGLYTAKYTHLEFHRSLTDDKRVAGFNLIPLNKDELLFAATVADKNRRHPSSIHLNYMAMP
jgi:hypothetical protein